jgi:hypothetical protein
MLLWDSAYSLFLGQSLCRIGGVLSTPSPFPSASSIFVGSMARRRGVEYGPSFKFQKHEENLSLSPSVAHLKRFFSTTKHTSKSFLTLADKEVLVCPFSPGSTLEPGLKGFH